MNEFIVMGVSALISLGISFFYNYVINRGKLCIYVRQLDVNFTIEPVNITVPEEDIYEALTCNHHIRLDVYNSSNTNKVMGNIIIKFIYYDEKGHINNFIIHLKKIQNINPKTIELIQKDDNVKVSYCDNCVKPDPESCTAFLQYYNEHNKLKTFSLSKKLSAKFIDFKF